MRMNRREILLVVAAIPVVACTQAADESGTAILVHKTESCGCCGEWVRHIEQAGFSAKVVNVDNLGPIKERVGVPYGKGSCHTAEVEGYFVEGHVPAAEIRRLLRERPDAKGLTVPGMPLGSPGMEHPSGRVDAYDVLLVANDGSTSIYASYGA